MQYVKFPMSVLRITQGYGLEVDGISTTVSGGTYSHTGSYALDLGGTDTGAEYLYAPCDVEVVRHYRGNTGYNAVWYQTLEPVMCADGQQRELVFMLLHANDSTITELGIAVGKQFKQGEPFYKEGTGGGVATHAHLEVGSAPFTGTGWYQSDYIGDYDGNKVWIINNKLIPSEIFYLTNETVVKEDMGYNWKYLTEDYAEYTTPTGVRVLTGTGKNVQYFNTANVDDVAGSYLPEGSEYIAVGYTTVADSYGFTYVKFVYDDGNEYWMALLDDRIELFERETDVSEILDKTFFLQVNGTDFNLNVYGNDTVEDERNVNIYAKEDVQAQRWVLKETTAGLKLFTRINESFALNIYTIDNNCSVYTANGNDKDSVIKLELVDNMLYKIKASTHNKYLYVDSAVESGTNVAWTDDSSMATVWKFVSEEEMFPTYIEYGTDKVIHVLDNNVNRVEYFYSDDVNDVAGILGADYKYRALGYTTEADENGFTYIKFEKGGAEYYTAYLTDRIEVIDGTIFTEDGIDVSDWQGVIDWTSVANDGVKFAIIKAVGTKSETGIYISDYWESNYQGAKDNGIKVGAYLYTFAFNETEAEEELTYLLKALKGKSFEYPIYIDVEDSLLYENCTVEQITNTVKYLCTRLKEEGYFPAIYTYANFAKNYLNMNELAEYDLWIADYTAPVDYMGDYTIWQYSSSGSINGIDGLVDMNISYKDYASLLSGENDGLDESTDPDEDDNEGGNTKMSTLNTRIVLRNDSTINWNANETVVLLKGEIGIEFLADGKAKVKIGDGVTPWSTLAYFSDDYTKSEVENLIATAKSEAISASVATVLGEGVDEKYDTLVEVANWILADSTSSAELVAKVNAIEEDYLKGADKTELEGKITVLSNFVGTLPEGATSSTVVAYIQEVVDGLKIGDYAKAADLTALAERVTALEGRATTIENNITNIISSVESVEEELAKKVDAVEGYRMVSEDEANKLEKLVLGEDGSVSVSGTIAAGNVDGLADWITARAATLKGLSENNLTDALLGKLNGIEEGAQVNVLEGVSVNGVALEVVEKVVDIKSTDIVKGSDEVTVAEDGTLGVGAVSVSKLVQGEGEVLILNGGSATV